MTGSELETNSYMFGRFREFLRQGGEQLLHGAVVGGCEDASVRVCGGGGYNVQPYPFLRLRRQPLGGGHWAWVNTKETEGQEHLHRTSPTLSLVMVQRGCEGTRLLTRKPSPTIQPPPSPGVPP